MGGIICSGDGDIGSHLIGESGGTLSDDLAGSNLGALGIEKDGDRLVSSLLEGGLEVDDGLTMALKVSVGEIEPGDVHASVDHTNQSLYSVASGTYRTDILGMLVGVVSVVQDVIEGVMVESGFLHFGLIYFYVLN